MTFDFQQGRVTTTGLDNSRGIRPRSTVFVEGLLKAGVPE
jgi:hypothetical protein